MQYILPYKSPIGKLMLASDGQSLTGLWYMDQKYFAETLTAQPIEKQLPIFEKTKAWLDCYFGGSNPDFTLPLYLEGTPFRMTVWKILQSIPYGEVITYKDIAEEIKRQKHLSQMSAQAVGGAVGHNPIGIIIPCHRVVGSNGDLTGYAGGLDKKIALLRLEHYL